MRKSRKKCTKYRYPKSRNLHVLMWVRIARIYFKFFLHRVLRLRETDHSENLENKREIVVFNCVRKITRPSDKCNVRTKMNFFFNVLINTHS